MTDPGNEAISVLVDIARTSGLDLNAGQRAQLDLLIAKGLIAPQEPDAATARTKYHLTSAGQGVLDKRGIGANES